MVRSFAMRVAALGWVALGCGGDAPGVDTTVNPPGVARIDLSPQTLSVVVGATQQLSATTFDAQGNPLAGRSISFVSSAAAVASVSASGLVTGVALGSASITASSEGRTATASVTVTGPQVASIAVAPASLTLSQGASASLSAVALGAAGDTLPGRAFTFSSANNAIATVTASGVVTGIAPGSTTVTVASEGRSRGVPVTVTATSSAPVTQVVLTPQFVTVRAGTTSQLQAAALDAQGVVLAGRSFTFVSNNPAVATVSGSGLITGVAAGSATITANSEGKQGSSSVTVTPAGSSPGPVARVVLSPGAMALPVGRQDQLTAVAYDAAGVAVPDVTYAFSSSAPAVATVTSTGLVTAASAGPATLTVSSSGFTATAGVTVTAGGNGAITRVDITPPASNVAVGASVQLTGVAYDAQGRVSTAEWYLWRVDNPVVAAVSQSGLVTGLAPGTVQVTMSAAGLAKTVPVTITGSAATNVITVLPGVQYQTMTGWQAAGQNGWLDCNPTAFARYKTELYDRLVNELGIDRLTTALQSGFENSRDYFADFVAGRLSSSQFADTWFQPVNDNADPLVSDSTKFFFGLLDGYVDNAVLPLRQRLLARGESLYWTLTYVDFRQNGQSTKPYLQMKTPEEYAELVLMAFTHLQGKYGVVPNALELVLEPENTLYTAPEVGRALVAVAARLRSRGFTPELLGPSTTSVWNASTWYDELLQVPGTRGLLSELVYHRYVALSYPALAAIGLRSQRDGIRTAMLEHIGSGIDALYEDVTIAGVSAWMQFSSAFCGNRDNPDNQGVYYQVNQTDPTNPRINITNQAKLLRQVFAYVRRGAVRLGATSGNATDLLPLAFRNANGKLVAVVRAKRGLSFSVQGLPAGTYGINFGTPGVQWNVNLPDQTIGTGGTIQTSIPSDGVITVYAR